MKFHEGARAIITLTESLQRQQIPAHMKKALKGSPIPLNIPTLSPELAPPTILTARRLSLALIWTYQYSVSLHVL